MASQDDLALLKQMYQRGEISDEQYDVLRRHVLWGTPLPQLIDEVPAPRAGTAGPGAAGAAVSAGRRRAGRLLRLVPSCSGGSGGGRSAGAGADTCRTTR